MVKFTPAILTDPEFLDLPLEWQALWFKFVIWGTQYADEDGRVQLPKTWSALSQILGGDRRTLQKFFDRVIELGWVEVVTSSDKVATSQRHDHVTSSDKSATSERHDDVISSDKVATNDRQVSDKLVSKSATSMSFKMTLPCTVRIRNLAKYQGLRRTKRANESEKNAPGKNIFNNSKSITESVTKTRKKSRKSEKSLAEKEREKVAEKENGSSGEEIEKEKDKGAAARKKRVKSSDMDVDGNGGGVQQLIDRWFQLYEQIRGMKPMWSAQNTVLLRRLMRQLKREGKDPSEELPRLFELYLRKKDAFYEKKGYPFELFYKDFNGIRADKNGRLTQEFNRRLKVQEVKL